jgi:peroxiredoxin Q/BCP
MLAVSISAPDFSLPDQDGTMHALQDYKGKWLLVYFYPKDDTPGCTAEACSMRDHYAGLKELVTILGISSDSVESHKKFAEKYHLPFTILADPEKKVIKAYEADGGLFTKRVSYLINPEGMIVKVYPKVKPEQHAEEILRHMQAFA